MSKQPTKPLETPLIVSNQEKQDLPEPLPAEWVSPANLGEVTLYQSVVSPPCCKLRTIFKHYGVQFKTVDGKKPDSDYKKIPVVVIHDRQINDSFIVVKSLARILDGNDLSPELLAIEEMTTFGLMMALEADVVGSCNDLRKCGSLIGGGIGCVLTSLSCILCCIGPRTFRKKHPEMKSLEAYRDEYAKALGNKQYFHGPKPGIVDVSLVGVLAPFVRAGNRAFPKFVGTSGPVFEWYERMKPTPQIF